MILVDTGAWVALLRQKDRHHKAARRFMSTEPSLLTTDYVVDETVTLLMSRVGKSSALQFLKAVLESRLVSLEPVGESGFAEAAALFQRYEDKHWSFTDCASCVVMKRMGISQVFGFDHHFEQMGFQRLPL